MPDAQKTNGTALVTGAARRIGRAIALALATDGYALAVHYRTSKADAEALVGEIRANGGRAEAIEADLAKHSDLETLTARCAKVLGPPRVLVNNASEFLLDGIESLDETTWDLHQAINLKAPVFLARDMALLLPEGVEGNIVNIIDQRVWNLTPDFFSYTISKAGLWTATRTLAQSLAPRIRVNAIAPGPVYKSVHQTPAAFAQEQSATLLQRGPEPEEIASAVRFILTTPSMTGQMIALDGGQHLI